MTLMAFATSSDAKYRAPRKVHLIQGSAHYVPAAPDFVAKFSQHLSEWKAQSVTMSSVAEQMSLPSFLAIVGMGEKVVDLIIDDLKKEPSFIFLALTEITRHNPVKPSDHGKPSAMIRAWIEWDADRKNVSC